MGLANGDRTVWLRRYCKEHPSMATMLRSHGNETVAAWVSGSTAGFWHPLEPREPLFAAIEQELCELYGAKTALQAVAQLRQVPLVSTANHDGLDTTALTFHCTLAQGLGGPPPGPAGPAFVVGLNCSSVSLDGYSFPAGIVLHDYVGGHRGGGQHRVPLLPARVRRKMVLAAPRIELAMLARAVSQVSMQNRAGAIGPISSVAALELLEEMGGSNGVASFDTYAQQARWVTDRLWSRAVSPSSLRYVSVPMERVVSRVLENDLSTDGSLLSQIFFNKFVRDALIDALDGVQGCWTGAEQMASTAVRPQKGTVFMWRLSPDGRRRALRLAGSPPSLSDAQDPDSWELPWSPDCVRSAIAAGVLIPSLFTCFAVLALARGLQCVGGPDQAVYLTAMRDALGAVLRQSGDVKSADSIADLPTSTSIADMVTCIYEYEPGWAIAAGAVEMSAARPLDAADLAQLGADLTVYDAVVAALDQTMVSSLDSTSSPSQGTGLRALIASSCPTVRRLKPSDTQPAVHLDR